MTPETKEIYGSIVIDYQYWRKNHLREAFKNLDDCVKDIERKVVEDEEDEEIMTNHIIRLVAVADSLSDSFARYSKELGKKQKSVRPE